VFWGERGLLSVFVTFGLGFACLFGIFIVFCSLIPPQNDSVLFITGIPIIFPQFGKVSPGALALLH